MPRERELVQLDTQTAVVSVTAPADVAPYERAFVELGHTALYGQVAAERTQAALRAL